MWAKLLTAILPTLVDLIGGWIKKWKAKKDARDIKKRMIKKHEKREVLVKAIEIAEEKNDHEKLKDLYVALHMLELQE